VLAGAAHPPPPIGSSSGHAGRYAGGRGGTRGAGGSIAPTADGTGGDADDDGGHSSGSGSDTCDHDITDRATDSDWTGSGGPSPSDSDNSASSQPLSPWDDDEYASDEMPPMDDHDEDEPPDVSTLFVEVLRHQTPVVMHGDMEYGATLSGRVLQWFHDLRDADESEPVFAGQGHIADLPRFDTPSERRVFSYVCTANGGGMGRKQASDFYATLRAVESATAGEVLFGHRFPNNTMFWKTIRNEKRRTLSALGWRTAPIDIVGRTYHLLYRDALNAAQELVRQARVDQLQGDATGPDDADTNDAQVWSGPFDSAAFLRTRRTCKIRCRLAPRSWAFTLTPTARF